MGRRVWPAHLLLVPVVNTGMGRRVLTHLLPVVADSIGMAIQILASPTPLLPVAAGSIGMGRRV